MTAEEYVKHYASGQGGYESVPVDIALRAIEYAKREAKQQMMAKAGNGRVNSVSNRQTRAHITVVFDSPRDIEVLDRLKVIVIKED